MTSDEPQRRDVVRPEEADDKDVPDQGDVPRAGPSRPILPVKKLPACGGLSITDPAFASQQTVSTSGCSNRATTSTSAIRGANHRGHKTKRSPHQRGPYRGGVSGRRGGRVAHRGAGRSLRAGKFSGPGMINRPAGAGTPTNQPDPRMESSGHHENPSEDLDSFVDHTPDRIQGYLYCW